LRILMVSRCSRITTEPGTCVFTSLKRPSAGPWSLRDGIAGRSRLRVARHNDIVERDGQHHGREYGGPGGEEVLRLGRPRMKDAIEPGDVSSRELLAECGPRWLAVVPEGWVPA
jgi:hypothetical protein